MLAISVIYYTIGRIIKYRILIQRKAPVDIAEFDWDEDSSFCVIDVKTFRMTYISFSGIHFRGLPQKGLYDNMPICVANPELCRLVLEKYKLWSVSVFEVPFVRRMELWNKKGFQTILIDHSKMKRVCMQVNNNGENITLGNWHCSVAGS